MKKYWGTLKEVLSLLSPLALTMLLVIILYKLVQ